jgi:hypothetical protein
MKLYRQLGYENWLPVMTSDVVLETVAGEDHVAPPLVDAAPTMS